MKKILFVDDDRAMAEYISVALGRKGYQVTSADSIAGALEAAEQTPFDLVVTDVRMGRDNGIDLCKTLATTAPDLPVLVVTAFGSLESAIAAIRAGAEDFLPKPFELDQLQFSIERALKNRDLKREVRRLRDLVHTSQEASLLLGESPAMRRVVELVHRIADVDTTVLITGESGTGKELVAQALHAAGRKSEPFVAINCGAIPEHLLESELFGHEKGAFTDAKSAREGLLVQAGSGTLFLDEIGDLPPTMQAKLLRVLQERKVRPVGGGHEVAIRARIVAATNKDLEEESEAGRFRQDLYFRLNVLQVSLPPLRARGNDVLLLAQHFLRRVAQRTGRPVQGIEPNAAAQLLRYPWPGNVRELQNLVERAVILTRHDHITLADLPERLQLPQGRSTMVVGDDPTELVPLEEIERRYILHVLEIVGGKRAEAAGILGLDRKTLYRKLSKYGADGGKLPRAGKAKCPTGHFAPWGRLHSPGNKAFAPGIPPATTEGVQKLLQGLHQFQNECFEPHKEFFERLARGQKPETLFITCSDSRINPNLLTQTQPGELFILRNAGNIIPTGGNTGGAEATIEYAITGLGVQNIVLCGHSHCGAMKALLNPKDTEKMPAVRSWLKYAETTRRIIEENYDHLDPQAKLTATVEENVLVQLENLRTLPAVASAIKGGRVHLHGWVYKIETGEVFAYNPRIGQFTQLMSENESPTSMTAGRKSGLLQAI